MSINLEFENCNYHEPVLNPESMDTIINLKVSFTGQIPTAQSKNTVKATILHLIQSELSKVTWICLGPIWVELTWFLDASNRQESDVVGDLDNITKPILDSLTGLEGIIIDDSQIKSIYTRWLANTLASNEQVLEISIRLLNEEALQKSKLYFIQYHNAMCFAIDLNPFDENELQAIKQFAHSKLTQRSNSENLLQEHRVDVRLHLIVSQKDFHRTRLTKIPANKIFKLT